MSTKKTLVPFVQVAFLVASRHVDPLDISRAAEKSFEFFLACVER
jgi:hypothetical protein